MYWNDWYRYKNGHQLRGLGSLIYLSHVNVFAREENNALRHRSGFGQACRRKMVLVQLLQPLIQWHSWMQPTQCRSLACWSQQQKRNTRQFAGMKCIISTNLASDLNGSLGLFSNLMAWLSGGKWRRDRSASGSF